MRGAVITSQWEIATLQPGKKIRRKFVMKTYFTITEHPKSRRKEKKSKSNRIKRLQNKRFAVVVGFAGKTFLNFCLIYNLKLEF